MNRLINWIKSLFKKKDQRKKIVHLEDNLFIGRYTCNNTVKPTNTDKLTKIHSEVTCKNCKKYT